jgi:hypothetical protein
MDAYILNTENNPVPKDILEAIKWKRENPALSRIGWDEVDGVTISTVFLVIDDAFLGDPKLFETCLFYGENGDGDSRVVDRYSTFDEAKIGHNQWIKKIRDGE